ncbi:MAG: hypothetical protein Q9162_004104 [Coniocarpon cinnabarinum]
MSKENHWPNVESLLPTNHWHADALRDLLARISFTALASEASTLRSKSAQSEKHVQCQVQPDKFNFGRYHFVFTLKFSDGIEWVARVPLQSADGDAKGIKARILNETAVMTHVRAHTSIPVPTIRGHNATKHTNQPVGAWFLLMDKMPGWHLEKKFANSVPEAYINKFTKQFGIFLYEICCLRFDRIGQLQSSAKLPCHITVSKGEQVSIEYISRRRAALNKKGLALDPTDRATQRACQILETIPKHAFQPSCSNGPFPLCHADFHYNNVLVDEDYNITAVLDWSDLCTAPWEYFAANPEFWRAPSASLESQACVQRFTQDVRGVIERAAEEKNDAMGLELAELIGSRKAELAHVILSTNALSTGRVQADALMAAVRVYGYQGDFVAFRKDILQADSTSTLDQWLSSN